MTTKRLFELFILNNTKGRDGVNPNANYIRTYGNVPFEEAFEVYLSNVASFISLKDKIQKLEKFLIANDAKVTHSNISESRYYFYNGVKYRFSGHVYPTGSMTDKILGVVDLAADPELINEVKF